MIRGVVAGGVAGPSMACEQDAASPGSEGHLEHANSLEEFSDEFHPWRLDERIIKQRLFCKCHGTLKFPSLY